MKVKSLLFFLFLSIGAFAQKAIEEKPIIKRRNPSDKLILGLNNDMWLNAPAGIKPSPFSPGFNLFYMFDVPFGIGNVGLGWGIGWSCVNLHSNGQVNYAVDSTSSKITTRFVPYPTDYKINKLVCNYIDVPVELRFRTYTSRFHFAIGMKAGYMVNSHTKEVDDAGKRKIYRIENLNKFQYGVTARIGVKRISLTAFYSLVPLIEKGKGDDKIVPFSIGIATRPF